MAARTPRPVSGAVARSSRSRLQTRTRRPWPGNCPSPRPEPSLSPGGGRPASRGPRGPALGVGSRAPVRVCTSARVSACARRVRPAPWRRPRTNLSPPSTPCPRVRPPQAALPAGLRSWRRRTRAGGKVFWGSLADFPGGPALVRVRGWGSGRAELVPWLPPGSPSPSRRGLFRESDGGPVLGGSARSRGAALGSALLKPGGIRGRALAGKLGKRGGRPPPR